MTSVYKVEMIPEGPKFSCLVQGYQRLSEWKLTTQECHAFIKSHVNMGITTVDHAHIYGSPSCESLFGKALKLDPSLRDQIEIVSKCGINLASGNEVAHYDSSRLSIISSVELSLARLGVECLDVLLLHRPDYLMESDEVAEAFRKLKDDGKVKYFGVSNFNSSQIELLQSKVDTPLITNQIEINLFSFDLLESGVLEKLQELKIRPMAWSCLGGGRMFDTGSKNMAPLINELKRVSVELDAGSIDQVVFSWIMKMPSKPIPILGSQRIDRIESCVDSLKISMNHEQWYRILAASRGHAIK